jgi:hypothetical protein
MRCEGGFSLFRHVFRYLSRFRDFLIPNRQQWPTEIRALPQW